MGWKLQATSRGESDFWTCHDFISQHSAAGAARWAAAYQEAAESLLANPNRGLAPESQRCDEEIRERIFKTPHGLPYRLLFVLRDELIYIIHVRGPGQDLMLTDEIELPNGE